MNVYLTIFLSQKFQDSVEKAKPLPCVVNDEERTEIDVLFEHATAGDIETGEMKEVNVLYKQATIGEINTGNN